MIRKGFNRTTPWFVVCAFIFSLSAVRSTPELTLDDLRKLEIICFVPSYLPKGFRLQRIDITYDEAGPDESKRQFPLYSIIYSNEPRNGATFSIESAREGIGDRNIMEEEDTEETEIQSPLGPMYFIYRPKGKNGRKDEIKANWVSDANMNAEKAKGPDSHPILGRFHGFSATGITLAEFTKIIQSLHPIRTDNAPAVGSTPGVVPAAEASALKIHPKVFNMNRLLDFRFGKPSRHGNQSGCGRTKCEPVQWRRAKARRRLAKLCEIRFRRIHALSRGRVEGQAPQNRVSGKRRRHAHNVGHY